MKAIASASEVTRFMRGVDNMRETPGTVGQLIAVIEAAAAVSATYESHPYFKSHPAKYESIYREAVHIARVKYALEIEDLCDVPINETLSGPEI